MSEKTGNILVADDHPDVITALKLLFKAEGYRVSDSASPSEALARVKAEEFDAALIDLNYREDTTSGKEGLRLLADLRAIDSDLPVIVMTAWGSVSVAVQAMQDGAGDFVEKPWDNQRLLSIVRNQIALGAARRSGQRLAAENALLRAGDGAEFIAESAAMGPVMEMVERVAASAANVLITGEHGTGKSLLARRIHQLSDRADKPLVTVNVGGLAEAVFESEMFGHVKGAFTDAGKDRVGRFEMASGGTLFLDEIANIPVLQQAKLLRVLEEGEFERVGSSRTQKVDVRVLSATNADPAELAQDSRFRQDLLFRLNTVEIAVPPLRNRRADIGSLCRMFLRQLGAKYRRQDMALSADALGALESHRWPGNVRELGHVLERALLMCNGSQIDAEHLHLAAEQAPLEGLEGLPLEDAERMLVQAALERANGNIMDAAGQLGLSRSAMYRRLEKHGLKDDSGQ